MTATKPEYDPLSLAELSFWEQAPEQREERFAVLRKERPISWHPPAEGSAMPPDPDGGFWAVVRHEDIQYVSKNPDLFCSGGGVIMEDVGDEIVEAVSSFLVVDAPRHTALRKLVSSAFTPRQIAKIDDQIAAQAKRLVDELIDTGDCDFVSQVAKKLPMWTIYEMVGLPPEKQDEATHGADGMVSWADPEVQAGREPAMVLMDSVMTLINTGLDLAEARRASPKDDLMTNLVQAEVDGQKLTDEEIAAFFSLLSVAGNDTTRNTISLSMKAFTDFPDQRKLLMGDFDGNIQTAIEEFVRWATPVMTFRRTATRDLELGGQQISEGDWVAMFYASGNRDETVFTDPMRFDIQRSPNHHVGFGGGGPHFCMGAQLARTQLRTFYKELFTRVPDIEVGEPNYLVGNFMTAVKSMPCKTNL